MAPSSCVSTPQQTAPVAGQNTRLAIGADGGGGSTGGLERECGRGQESDLSDGSDLSGSSDPGQTYNMLYIIDMCV